MFLLNTQVKQTCLWRPLKPQSKRLLWLKILLHLMSSFQTSGKNFSSSLAHLNLFCFIFPLFLESCHSFHRNVIDGKSALLLIPNTLMQKLNFMVCFFHHFVVSTSEINVEDHFSLNQCRSEEITLKENFENNFLNFPNFGEKQTIVLM